MSTQKATDTWDDITEKSVLPDPLTTPVQPPESPETNIASAGKYVRSDLELQHAKPDVLQVLYIFTYFSSSSTMYPQSVSMCVCITLNNTKIEIDCNLLLIYKDVFRIFHSPRIFICPMDFFYPFIWLAVVHKQEEGIILRTVHLLAYICWLIDFRMILAIITGRYDFGWPRSPAPRKTLDRQPRPVFQRATRTRTSLGNHGRRNAGQGSHAAETEPLNSTKLSS